jgi:hypothetical protein
VELWRGPFLEDFDPRDCPDWDEWLEVERQTWQQRILDTLERGAEASALEHDWATGLARARQVLALDPLQERFHRLTMRLHEQAGDRAAALSHYRLAAQTLRSQLGVEPDPTSQRLYREILTGGGKSPLSARAAPVHVVERPGARAPAFPLVGRQAALAQLSSAADAACAGRGRLIVIDGEEGIGKSRLVEELVWLNDGERARELRPDVRWTVLGGTCHASEHGLPYRPFVDLLTEAVSSFGPNVRLSDVWLAEVARLVPDLVEQRPDLPTPARLDPQQEARRLFEGVARFLAALPVPRLLVIEAAHARSEEVHDQATLAAGEAFLSAVYHMRGEWAAARRHGLLALELARATGSVIHEYVALVYVGLPEARMGNPEAGASWLQRAIAMAAAAGTVVLLGRAHAWLAEIELGRGDAEQALELAARGMQFSVRHGYLFDAGLCERVQGQPLVALGQKVSAAVTLERARDHFAAIGAQPELERTRAALSALG